MVQLPQLVGGEDGGALGGQPDDAVTGVLDGTAGTEDFDLVWIADDDRAGVQTESGPGFASPEPGPGSPNKVRHHQLDALTVRDLLAGAEELGNALAGLGIATPLRNRRRGIVGGVQSDAATVTDVEVVHHSAELGDIDAVCSLVCFLGSGERRRDRYTAQRKGECEGN
jgi:hypothetical protein